MKQKMTKFFLVLCCGMIIAAGCAKKEMVKSEEPVVPPKAVEAPPAPPAAAEPAKEAPAVKEETLQEPVKAVAPEAALQPVYYDFDSYVLSADARDILKKDADAISKI